MKDLNEMPDEDFHIKAIHFKSVSDGMNVGICSVKVELTNGYTSGDLKVDGVTGQTSGTMLMPRDPKVIKSAQAYSDD